MGPISAAPDGACSRAGTPYFSRLLKRGRNANHHTERIVANAPANPRDDLMPLPVLSVIDPS